ncbi:MAG: ArsR/SmtB family transcription factor [Phycisphaerae bacterium]
MTVLTVDDAFRALADARRRELISILAREGTGTSVGLAQRLNITRQAVAKHFRVLQKARLVTKTRRGREEHYNLSLDQFAAVREWMREVEIEWDRRLDRLKALVETPEE